MPRFLMSAFSGKQMSLMLSSLLALFIGFQQLQTPQPEAAPKQPLLKAAGDPCMYTLNTYGATTGFVIADLYDVNSTTGAVTSPTGTSFETTLGLEINSTNELFTVELKFVPFVGLVSKLHKVNLDVMASTFIGDLDILVFEGDLAMHPITEELYGVGGDGELFIIDQTTALTTMIGTIPSPNASEADISYLSFDLSGNLYALDNGTDGSVDSYWLEIDPGTAGVIGSNLIPKVEDPGGMDVNPVTGQIYLLESDGDTTPTGPFELHTVDPATGALTSVGPLVNDQPYSGVAFCGPPPPCTTPPADMVAWWAFDEPAAFTGTLDLSASTPNPSFRSGSAIFTADQTLSLTGGHMDAPDHPELNMGQLEDFSIDAWIKTQYTGFNQTIVDKRESAGSPGYLLTVYGGRLLLQMADSGGWSNYWSATTPILNDGNWHFVAVSVDRDQVDGIKFHVDGNQVAVFNPLARPGSLTNASPVRIGKHSFADISRFVGEIDEVEIFKRALSEAEFDLIYEAGESGKCKPCMAVTALSFAPSTPQSDHSNAAILANLRRFRDTVMSQTQTGQHFAELYRGYNMRAAWILLRDRNLRQLTIDLLRKYHSVFLDVVKGRANYHVSQDMIQDGKSWLTQLMAADLRYAGGGDLADAIQNEMQRIDWEGLSDWQVQNLLTYYDRR